MVWEALAYFFLASTNILLNQAATYFIMFLKSSFTSIPSNFPAFAVGFRKNAIKHCNFISVLNYTVVVVFIQKGAINNFAHFYSFSFDNNTWPCCVNYTSNFFPLLYIESISILFIHVLLLSLYVWYFHDLLAYFMHLYTLFYA